MKTQVLLSDLLAAFQTHPCIFSYISMLFSPPMPVNFRALYVRARRMKHSSDRVEKKRANLFVKEEDILASERFKKDDSIILGKNVRTLYIEIAKMRFIISVFVM